MESTVAHAMSKGWLQTRGRWRKTTANLHATKKEKKRKEKDLTIPTQQDRKSAQASMHNGNSWPKAKTEKQKITSIWNKMECEEKCVARRNATGSGESVDDGTICPWNMDK